MATYSQFFTDVLHKLGLPATKHNLAALASVSILEGLNNRYNPLNSVVKSGDSTTFNSVGVQDYKSYTNGVNGTVALLQGSTWSGVVAALREGNSTGNVLSAFQAAYATWGSHVTFPNDATRQNTVLSASIGPGKPTPKSLPGGKKVPTNPASIPDATVQAMIRAIIAHPPSAFIKQSLISKFGADGKGFPKTIPKSTDPSKPSEFPAGDTRAKEVANILHLYFQATGQEVPLAPADPGEAQAGLGPTGIGISDLWGPLKSLIDAFMWLTKPENWIRIGEFVLGAVIIVFSTYYLFKEA